MNTGHKRKPTYVKPKDASTVILLRRRPNAGTNGIEVLMVLRHPGNRFVADAYVYPGGALDEEDCAPAMEVALPGNDPGKSGRPDGRHPAGESPWGLGGRYPRDF